MLLRLLPLALVFFTHLVVAETRTVELAPGLHGEWISPETGWTGAAVLVFHGLADDMDGPRDLTKRAALALVDRGIATLRINFRGEGDRHRTRIESTFLTRIADAEAARDFVLSRPGVNPKKVGAFGWSLGAATAIEVASRRPELLPCIVVWCAPGGDLHTLITTEPPLHTAAGEAERKGGWGEVDLGWKKIELSTAFFESYRGFHTDTQLARYTGAFLSIRGSEDFLPQSEAAYLKAVAGRPAEAVLIAGADHIFNTFQPELGHDARAIALTADWFVRNLR
jgi:alpha/beta superfamily hydrolase